MTLDVAPDTAPTAVRQKNLTVPCFPTSVPTLDAMAVVTLVQPKPMGPVTAPMVPPMATFLA